MCGDGCGAGGHSVSRAYLRCEPDCVTGLRQERVIPRRRVESHKRRERIGMKQLTTPLQTIIHPDDETTVIISTVWIREGSLTPWCETAVIDVDVESGKRSFPMVHKSAIGESLFSDSKFFLETTAALEHWVAVRAYHKHFGKVNLGTLCDEIEKALEAVHVTPQ